MKNKGFTVLELLIVMALIGLLSSIVLVGFQGAKERANIAGGLHFNGQIKHYLGYWAVGIWDLNKIEDGNKVLDSSGNNNHGTVYGATLVKSIPELGYALSFDGNDYVKCEYDKSFDITNEITMEAWVKYQPKSGCKNIINRRDVYCYTICDDQFRFYLNTATPPTWSPVWIGSIKSLEAGKWYHTAVSYSKTGGVRLWINGKLDKTNLSWAYPIQVSGYGIIFGSLENIWTDYYKGLIDEVRIYNQALTSAQIQKLYAEGIKTHQLTFNEK